MVSVLDQVFVILLFIASLSLSWFYLGLSTLCSSPGRLLSGTVYYSGQILSHAGSVYCTDPVLTTIATLPSLRSFPGWFRPGASIFLRSIFFLCLVFLIA